MGIHDFGWNVVTISFVGAVSLTILQMFTYGKQGWAIWQEKSAAGISIYWFLYLQAVLWEGAIYGVWARDFAIGFNGVGIGVVILPMFVGILRAQSLTRNQKIFFWTLSVGLAASIISPEKKIFFFVFSLGNIGAFASQTLKLWWEKKNGVVRPGILFSTLVSTTFWTVYSISVGEPVLRIVCPIYLVLALLTTILWFQNRKSEAAAI